MSTQTERSVGRTAFVVVRAAVVAGAWWYLAAGLAGLFDAAVEAAGAGWIVGTPLGFLLTASAFPIAFALVFAAFAYWHYRVRLLGVVL
ncbi:hypothetical protein [Halegenticoccus soli]|uniref:hypothetical protein n=1 Tax=Halegenticoccus soli TaxID=1985678 RepID=UPI000C6D446D|nr:hypothetical protein [Halegenticoccus soli]